MITFQANHYPVGGISFPLPKVTRYQTVVAFTGTDRMDPVVFYEIQQEDSKRMLQRFFDRHPTWEISAHWSRVRFYGYLKERTREALPALHFRESHRGLMHMLPHPKRSSAALSLYHHTYVPQQSSDTPLK